MNRFERLMVGMQKITTKLAGSIQPSSLLVRLVRIQLFVKETFKEKQTVLG
jgi:hypothetical protein